VACVALPSVYSFLETVVDSLRAMYAEAGAPLHSIHMGGDEVPAGAWEDSPACVRLIAADTTLETTDDLWAYYFRRVGKMLRERELVLSGWEEISLQKNDGVREPNPALAGEGFQIHAWNNGMGWEEEDLPYRLANAGYKVVLSCVSSQYFTLAYEKTAAEPGFYWAGYNDLDQVFGFVPLDFFRNVREFAWGEPVSDPAYFDGKTRLTEQGKSNIVGIQGLLWAEGLRDMADLEYMLLPKMLGLAERAWAPDPDEWTQQEDPDWQEELYKHAWSRFTSSLGLRELPRLDVLNGGYAYRVPTPGAQASNGKVYVNCQIPGFEIHYSIDGLLPTRESPLYEGPIETRGNFIFCCFAKNGRRGLPAQLGNW
jgi:hexosaminidase